MVIHPSGVTPPPFSDCDLAISASYGKQQFKAATKQEYLDPLQAEWPKLIEQFKQISDSPVSGDMRSDARSFIFSMIMENWQYEDVNMAAMTASAIVWLARTSPVGQAVGKGGHKQIHYEITDTGDQRHYWLTLQK